MSAHKHAEKSDSESEDDAAAPNSGAGSIQETKDDESMPPSLPFTALVNPMKGGVLTKQGKKYLSWKKRLFLLSDRYLYYFVTADDKAPRGVLSLNKCKVEQEIEIGKEKGVYCFSIQAERSWNVHRRKKFTNRKYYFCTAILSEMNDWMALIRSISKT